MWEEKAVSCVFYSIIPLALCGLILGLDSVTSFLYFGITNLSLVALALSALSFVTAFGLLYVYMAVSTGAFYPHKCDQHGWCLSAICWECETDDASSNDDDKDTELLRAKKVK